MTFRSPAVRICAVATTVICLSATLAGGATASQISSEQRTQHDNIFISGDAQFNPANGVRAGSGTKRDPFVISGWSVSSLTVKDTSAHLVVRDNTIQRLVLDWNGPGVTVVDNEVGDLRVNQNVKRTGAATGGRIANNRFGRVGQLRHFDGVFENNVVKPTGMALPLFSREAVQFDGFHGSRFRNNTIYGSVDVKLHGHHHGSSFGDDSHHHGAPEAAEGHAGHEGHGTVPDMDHTKRYHEVFISNNVIYADGDYALRYTDQAHAGDDRTAPSETNPELNADHVHYTRIHLVGNELKGAGLMVDIFNADDSRHTTGTERGLVNIRNNQISLARNSNDYPWTAKDGISLRAAKDATVRVVNNSVVGEDPQKRDLLDEQFSVDAGINLYGIDLADIYLEDNRVGNMLYGIRAAHMTETVRWLISDLTTSGVSRTVYWDNSVKNPPERRP